MGRPTIPSQHKNNFEENGIEPIQLQGVYDQMEAVGHFCRLCIKCHSGMPRDIVVNSGNQLSQQFSIGNDQDRKDGWNFLNSRLRQLSRIGVRR